MHESIYIEKLKNLLIKNLEKLKSKNPEEIAIAFSGGVDSAIIAKLLKHIGINPPAYVVGIENCKDFDSAEEIAGEIGLKLKKIILTEEEIREDLPIQVRILKELYEKNQEKIKPQTTESKLNPVSVSSNFPLYFVEKHAKERYIVSGLGADTLLGGFAKYLTSDKQDSIKEIEKSSKNLILFDYLEDLETAKYLGKEIIMPFLDKDVIEFCLNLPYELKINNNTRKYILRKLAKQIGLSDNSAFKEKKSAQYGSGLMKIMKKIAKKEGMKINEYIKDCIKNL